MVIVYCPLTKANIHSAAAGGARAATDEVTFNSCDSGGIKDSPPTLLFLLGCSFFQFLLVAVFSPHFINVVVVVVKSNAALQTATC